MRRRNRKKAQQAMTTAKWYAMMLDDILEGQPNLNYIMYIDLFHKALSDVEEYDDSLFYEDESDV